MLIEFNVNNVRINKKFFIRYTIFYKFLILFILFDINYNLKSNPNKLILLDIASNDYNLSTNIYNSSNSNISNQVIPNISNHINQTSENVLTNPKYTNNTQLVFNIPLIHDFKKNIFYTKLSIGSQEQNLTFLISSFLDYTILQSKTCINCNKSVILYDRRQSSNFRYSGDEIYDNYLDSNYYGLISFDKITFNSKRSLNNYGFLLLEKHNINITTDSVLSLSRGTSKFKELGKSFILSDYFLENRIISKNIFTLIKNGNKTKLFFGDLPEYIKDDKENLTYCNNIIYPTNRTFEYLNNYWTCNLSYFFVNDYRNNSEIIPSENNKHIFLKNSSLIQFNRKNSFFINSYAAFEIGINNILSPMVYFDKFVDYLKLIFSEYNFLINFEKEENFFIKKNNSKILLENNKINFYMEVKTKIKIDNDKIDFTLKNNNFFLYKKFFISKDNFENIFNTPENLKNNKIYCYLNFNGIAYGIKLRDIFYEEDERYYFSIIFSNFTNIFIIGNIFFKNYDIIFDKTSNKIGFYNTNPNFIERLNFTNIISDVPEKIYFSTDWIFILGNILLILVVGFTINWWLNRKQHKEELEINKKKELKKKLLEMTFRE